MGSGYHCRGLQVTVPTQATDSSLALLDGDYQSILDRELQMLLEKPAIDAVESHQEITCLAGGSSGGNHGEACYEL